MLRLTRTRCCLSVGVACRTLGLRAPPRDKKELKKHFIALAKEHHPDQNADNVAAATKRMVQLTEAYTTLKKLLDSGVHAHDMHNRRASAAGGSSSESSAMSEAEAVAASFQAPGSSLSLRTFTLPWQRSASSTSVAAVMSSIEQSSKCGSFGEYVCAMRTAERVRQRREDRVQDDSHMAQGSHGFTKEHFDEVNKMNRQLKGLETKLPTHIVPLAWRYYRRKFSTALSEAPRRWWEAARFIVLG